MIFLGWILLIASTGCRLETPEIRGVVLDAETKQPVPEAWIHARLGITTRTVQGDVHGHLSVNPPHTRSNERGEFLIPAWHFDPPPVPYGFGTKVEHFNMSAETIDDRIGGFGLKDYEGKDVIEVIIYVKHLEVVINDRDYLHSGHSLFLGSLAWESYKKGNIEETIHWYLRSLYDYCFWGRFSNELPVVKEGCDEWELNYAILKHERFLKRLGEPKTMDQRTYYSATLRHLGYLYKRKKDYKNALDAFEKLVDFNKKRNVMIFMSQDESQIREVREILGIK